MRLSARAAAVASLAVVLGALLAAADVRVRDLDDRSIDPLKAAAGTKAMAFLFVSVECPISNRYAPEVRRLYDKFTAQGISFSLVYPNPVEPVAAIRRHLKDYSYPMRALRDPRHDLVKLAGATITPEAVVIDPQGRVLYRGRIDDRYVSLGLERPVATRHDLDEALTDVLAGKAPRQATTQAVGCYIADFVQ
jgi:AhpC/TSA family protein